MFFEFQLSADVIGSIIRNQFHQIDLGISQVFDFLGQSMIDHISIESTTTLQRAPGNFTVNIGGTPHNVAGHKAVIAQPLRLALVKVADLVSNNTNATAPFLSPEISILIAVTATVSGGDAQLSFAFDSIDFGSVGAFLSAAQKQDITNTVQGKFSPIVRSIDTSSVQDMLPGVTIQLTNAGVTTTSDGTALILRIEAGAGQLATWTDFYNTYDRNLLGGRKWAMLMDKDLLIPNIQNTLNDQLSGAADKFALESNIDVTWQPAFGPMFDVAFSGEVIDACICTLFEVDLNVDVSCGLLFQAPGNDQLRMHITTDYSGNKLEEACCELTSALFWPVVGLVYLGEGKTTFGQYVLGMVGGPLLTFIATCVAFGNQGLAGQLAKDGTCTKVDDQTVDCDQQFTLDMGAMGGVYHLNSITAQSEGPVFSGTTTAIKELLDPLLSVGDLEQFQWGLGGSCGKGFHAVQSGAVGYSSALPGSILMLTEVSVLDDPLGVFADLSYDKYFITIKPKVNPAYLAAPYPCKVRIVSNGGIRIITLDPAKEITSAQSKELGLEAIKAKASCYLQISKLPWSIGKYKWLPDPPPDYDLAQIWQVVVSELEAKDKMELLGNRQAVLATATPNQHGLAQASYWAEGKATLKELDVRVTVAAQGKTTRNAEACKRHVALRQIQLVERSRIALTGEFQGLQLERRNGRPVLTVHSSGATRTYDLRLPAAPARLSVATGAREELCVRNGLQISLESSQLCIRDGGGKVLRNLKVTNRETLALSANRLYLAEAKGVSMFSLTGKTEQLALPGLNLADGARLWTTRLLGVPHALAISDNKNHVRVYDVSDPKHVHELVQYLTTPWFLAADRCGELLAKLSADGKSVRVYEVDQTIDI